jgi:hypothetical protein
MPTGRHIDHDKSKHHVHSKHELKEKLNAHRHKIPSYVARELAHADMVAKALAKTPHTEERHGKE